MKQAFPFLDELVKRLRRADEVPLDLMNSVVNEITDTRFSDRKRSVASEISESAGMYLESWALLDFISAKFTDSDMNEMVDFRKTVVSRLAELLPSIVDLLRLTDSRDISSAIHQIYDCVKDYPIVETSEYSTKQRKKIVHGINLIIELAEQLNEALDDAGRHIDIELQHHKDAEARIRGNERKLTRIEAVQHELMVLCFASRLTLYRDQIGERSFYVGDNKAKTHVVVSAYRLALQFGTPVLKTTPGSDFSTLCSLMFELATGMANESLAGAINKFARSSERREIDEEEVLHRYENSDEGIAEYEADNFSSVKGDIRACEEEEEFWLKMISSRKWDENSLHHMTLRLIDTRRRKKDAVRRPGPFIIWASQMSTETFVQWREESERHEDKLLALAIEVGEKTRSR